MGAEVATNNVGELAAMIEALLWLEAEAPGPAEVPATIFYDSFYAYGAITGAHAVGANDKTCREGAGHAGQGSG